MDLSQSIEVFKGLFANLQAAGGIPDCVVLTDASISASDATLLSPSNPFSASIVNQVVCVVGGGVAGADLITTISSYTGPGSVELSDAASTTVSAGVAVFGTDNGAAFAAYRGTCTDAGRKFLIPSGWYLTTSTVDFESGSIEVEGQGRDNSASAVIVYVGTGTAVHIHPAVGDYYCYALNMERLQVVCYGGARNAIYAQNLSQADFFRVGINQSDGAHADVGWNLENPNILKFHRPIVQLCGTAFLVSSTGNPDSATNFHIDGGNIYQNDTVFDLRANIVHWTVNGVCHFEQFTDLIKIDRSVGAADLQLNSFTIDNCEITASTGTYTSKLLNVAVPGVTTLIAATFRFTNNWVYFGSASANPMYFDVAGGASAEIDLHVSKNVFSNIDTALIHAPAAGITVYYSPNKRRFGSEFNVLSAGSTAKLYTQVYGGDNLTVANRVPFVSEAQELNADAGLTYYGTAGSKILEIASDNETDGQVRVGTADASRVLAVSVPTAAYTVVLKLLGALSAVAVKGLLTVGSDEQPSVTLFVHNNDTGGHTQLQIKGNAADGGGNALLNIITSSGAAALQILGDRNMVLPLLTSAKFLGVNGGGTVEAKTSVSLTADVSGTLPVGNGGTGQTTLAGYGGALLGDATFLAALVLALATYYYTQTDIDNKLSTDYYDKTAINSLLAGLQGQIDTLTSDVSALDSAISGLISGKADHGTYAVTGGGGGSVDI